MKKNERERRVARKRKGRRRRRRRVYKVSVTGQASRPPLL